MRRTITTVATALLAVVGSVGAARAQNGEPARHYNGGLGFHEMEAPIGLRWWFADQKLALDLGFGFGSEPAQLFADESVSRWAVDVGVPIVMKSWPRVHVLLRPGILYRSQQVEITSPPAAFDTDNETTFNLMAEIEAEVFLADNFSVSASHGIAYESFNPVGPGDSITSFGTRGRNFTSLGFHAYFLGGSHP